VDHPAQHHQQANDTGTINSGRHAKLRLHHPRQVRAQHQELAMRDVQDAHQPVLQVQAQRDQRVDAPGDETGGQFNPGAE
jgi:hypothetical protein